MQKKGGEIRMKKISLILAMLCLGITMTTSSAMAFSLSGSYAGPVKFEFGSFDSGTTGYPAPGAGVVVADWPGVGAGGSLGGPGADGVAGSAAPTSNPASPYVPGVAPDGNIYGAGTANEDSWGIFDVSRIVNPGNGATLWTKGDNGEFLTGYFHNEVDHYVKQTGTDSISGLPIYEIRGVGGEIEMFLDTTDDFAALNSGPTGRNGFDIYGGLGAYGYPGSAADDGSEGTLFLSAALSPGVMLGDGSTTFVSNFSPAATFLTNGLFFLDVTGGAFAGMFDTNQEFDINGNAHDVQISYTARPHPVWTVSNTGDAFANVVPEPTSMLLFGMGMLGLATRIRRKKAA